MSASGAVLVIGFPGEIARRTAAELARRGRSVRILAPPGTEDGAAAFAAGLSGPATVVAGDARLIDFGLPGSDYLALAAEIDGIVLAEPPAPPGHDHDAPPGREAIREIFELGVAASNPAHAVILSQVDVAGDFRGRFAERDLELGQRFEGESQRERFGAERVCRRLAGRLPMTVVRAGWAVGPAAGLVPVAELVLAAGDDIERCRDRRLALAAASGLSGLLACLAGLPPGPEGRVLHAVDPALPTVGEFAQRVRTGARGVAPASFDLEAGARRLLQRAPGAVRWAPREFFERQPRARIETAWSEGFLAANGLPGVGLGPDGMTAVIEHAIEGIVGLR